MEDSTGYKRGLKARHISLIALGGIIGSSYFLGTGYVLNQVGPGAFLAYAIGGLITYMTMVCLSELSILNPTPGSFVSYAEKYVSKSWASGVGWSYWVSWVVYVPSECVAAGILMHHFIPEMPVYFWAAVFGVLITMINLINVKAFGEFEFWLAIIKIILLAGFSFFAVLILFNFFGGAPTPKTEYFLKDGGLFPNGWTILFVNMVILLANFQGSEIIGLSAAESEDPKKNIPRALRTITYRIIGLYLIPTFLLAMIFPWQKAGLSGSVFAFALEKYGLLKIGQAFSFLIIAGAISSANSGLYATIRSLHALSLKGVAPRFLQKVEKNGIPQRATYLTLGSMWVLLITSYFFSSHSLYANLLALSGFTGSICWISICWSQYNFRKKMFPSMSDEDKKLLQVPFFPSFTLFAIFIQVFCLFIVLWTPSLRSAFYFGIPAVFIPVLIEMIRSRMKRQAL